MRNTSGYKVRFSTGKRFKPRWVGGRNCITTDSQAIELEVHKIRSDLGYLHQSITQAFTHTNQTIDQINKSFQRAMGAINDRFVRIQQHVGLAEDATKQQGEIKQGAPREIITPGGKKH